jgi:DHA2 family multidrug resistance protein
VSGAPAVAADGAAAPPAVPPAPPSAAAAGSPSHPPLRGAPLVLATLALSLGSFMNFLDLSIANVSVPHIAGDLAVSPTQGTWVITSYAMAEAIVMPLTGWFGTRFGLVRMFIWSTMLFTLASLLCGISVSFPMLIGARVLQGMVGAAMIPLAQALLITCYPPHQRGLALGLWTMTAITAPIAGPLVGGWITDHYSWHWIFLVNLPVGVGVAMLAAALLRERETATRKVPVDWVGLGLLVLGVGSLQVMLDMGNELDWFESDFIVAMACVAVVTLLVFVAWELTEEHPIVDLRLFARRNFAIGTICLFIGVVAFFGTLVVLPLWLQTYQGYTSMWAGKAIATGGIFAMLLGPVIGANLHRVDARAVTTFGFVFFAAVAFWSGRFTPDVDFVTVMQTRLWMGIGIACFFLPITTIALSGIEADRYASASGLNNFVRNIGSSFGTALVISVWDRQGIAQRALLVEKLDPWSPATAEHLARAQELGLSQQAALAQLEPTLSSQAYLIATNWVLWACGALMLSMLPIVWWAKPPFVARAPARR